MAGAAGSHSGGWRAYFGAGPSEDRGRRGSPGGPDEDRDSVDSKPRPEKWSLGILNDKQTAEVPGSVLLLASDRNEPLGLRSAPARRSTSSIPVGNTRTQAAPQLPENPKKTTSDGKIILNPQPDDSANDPLNWSVWRRDSALLSLGLYCMVGGGTTTLLAAGFTNVSETYDVSVSRVSLTTGLYMMGLGLGSVVFSPTAILYGKRPVYLFSAVLFILTSVWCALSPNFASLIVARIAQGVAVSPVECLPSATIAEIFFLHERAFRIGIYTLLLLGGKNLIPLVSAAIIQRLGWRWVFWMVAIVVGLCGSLLFLFVPETFWDRAPMARKHRKTEARPNFFRRFSSRHDTSASAAGPHQAPDTHEGGDHETQPKSKAPRHRSKGAHIGFAPDVEAHDAEAHDVEDGPESHAPTAAGQRTGVQAAEKAAANGRSSEGGPSEEMETALREKGNERGTPSLTVTHPEKGGEDGEPAVAAEGTFLSAGPGAGPGPPRSGCPTDADSEKQSITPSISHGGPAYTATLREQPAKSFVQQLKPFHGRLHQDKWHKVAVRPLILFLYPSVLWSAVVYACSVGWLIVISESVSVIYRDGTYHFTALQTGLVYISPFVGGILGTAVAGRVSDIVVKSMARRNGGLYEPEFRLVMAAPIAVTTAVGLMGFGWSAEVRDSWIVPTVFFGMVSFGCCLGSTTSITFCVDSYRQYAGEALVTLNFSKNICHGLVFSLFVTGWLTDDGPKQVFVWIGIIQLILLASTIPLYIYGKRARMWTVRKNFMEKF